jgi:hypothetical protein
MRGALVAAAFLLVLVSADAQNGATGIYELLNVFGTPTGRAEHVMVGDALPRAPLGFTFGAIWGR